MAFIGSFDDTWSRVLFKVHAGSTVGSKRGTGTVGIVSMVFVKRMVLDV